MQKLEKPISKHLPPVKIYLEDVQELYDLLAKSCKEVKMETDEWVFSDCERLQDLGVEEIHYLELQGEEPNILLCFSHREALIHIEEDSTLNRGIFSQLEDTLRRCYRKVARVFAGTNTTLALLIVLVVVTLSSLEAARDLVGQALVGILAFIFGAIIYWLHFRFSTKAYSTVVLSKRRERQNFFVKNKDQILVGIITAVVSVALTILALKVLGLLS